MDHPAEAKAARTLPGYPDLGGKTTLWAPKDHIKIRILIWDVVNDIAYIYSTCYINIWILQNMISGIPPFLGLGNKL